MKLTLAFLLFGGQALGVSAQNTESTSPDESTSQTPPTISTEDNAENQNENITLQGQIGPYDPSENDKGDPNFGEFEGDNLEGTLPEKYFTISLTVPTALEFTVFEHKIDVKGQFYSPQYKVTNNATRPVHILVKAVDNVVPSTNEDDYIPLYLEKPLEGDGRVQIDLNLSFNNLKTSVFHNVNLTSMTPSHPIILSASNDSQVAPSNYLGVLGLKEQGVLQLNSTDWDRPKAEGFDKDAKLNFDVSLIFSLDDPTTPPVEDGNEPSES